jgi:hypothetical protein
LLEAPRPDRSNPASFNLASFSPEGMRLPWLMPWPDKILPRRAAADRDRFGGGSFLIDLAQREPSPMWFGVPSAPSAASRILNGARDRVRCGMRLICMDGGNAGLSVRNQRRSIRYINFPPDPFPALKGAHASLSAQPCSRGLDRDAFKTANRPLPQTHPS